MSISITHESYSFLALATISEDEKSPLKSHNMGATQEAVTLFFRKGDQTQRPWFGQTRFQLRGSTPGLFRFPGLEKQKHACFGSKFRPLSPLAFNSHVEDHIAMTPEHGMKVWVFALLFFHLCIVPVVSVECRPPLMEQPSNSATELFARLDGFVQQPSLPTGPEPELMNEFAPFSFSRLFPSFIDVHLSWGRTQQAAQYFRMICPAQSVQITLMTMLMTTVALHEVIKGVTCQIWTCQPWMVTHRLRQALAKSASQTDI